MAEIKIHKQPRLHRPQELQMLEKALAVSQAEWEEMAACPAFEAAQLDIAEAALEAAVNQVKLNQTAGLRNVARALRGPRAAGLMVAAAVRCLRMRCMHAGDAKVSKTVYLAPRMMFCTACTPAFLGDLARHDREGRGADECDLCLARPTRSFRQIIIQSGGYLFLGDVCNSCWREMGGGAGNG